MRTRKAKTLNPFHSPLAGNYSSPGGCLVTGEGGWKMGVRGVWGLRFQSDWAGFALGFAVRLIKTHYHKHKVEQGTF